MTATDLPLKGVRLLEFEGIGPGPLAALMLSQMGAEITVIARPTADVLTQKLGAAIHAQRKGKKVLPLDLKGQGAVEQALALAQQSDGLIEGNRPGVMERLGLGPDVCLKRNSRLVYGRMTGWGQSGPLAHAAGHDLNYVALSGLLSLSAHRGERPMIPPTVLGDAAGALGMAYGMVCALMAARVTGQGRVVDAAIVDIDAMLGTLVHWIHSTGQIGGAQPSLFHDSPFYDVYKCADGRWITVAAMEPQFYKLLLEKLELRDIDPSAQFEKDLWPSVKGRFSETFLTRTRDEWCTVLEGTDVCFAPVLSVEEAAAHPHNLARGTFGVSDTGAVQARTAPRVAPL